MGGSRAPKTTSWGHTPTSGHFIVWCEINVWSSEPNTPHWHPPCFYVSVPAIQGRSPHAVGVVPLCPQPRLVKSSSSPMLGISVSRLLRGPRSLPSGTGGEIPRVATAPRAPTCRTPLCVAAVGACCRGSGSRISPGHRVSCGGRSSPGSRVRCRGRSSPGDRQRCLISGRGLRAAIFMPRGCVDGGVDSPPLANPVSTMGLDKLRRREMPELEAPGR